MVISKINRVILCIIDDVRSSHFFEFINKGFLPNFKKLMENGVYSKTCITDFPSVTYPTQPTILTGTYTGNFRKEPCHGVPAYHWMDRGLVPPILRDYGGAGSDEYIQIYKMNDDLGNNCQTLLEMIGEGNRSSITQLISRGANYLYPESKFKLVLYYELLSIAFRNKENAKKIMERANTVVIRKILNSFKKPTKYFETNEVPIGINLWFMSSDVLMHAFGFDSPIYKLNLMHIDKVMGVLLEGLENMGYLEDTAIAITTDHGNYKLSKRGNITPFFEKIGLTNYHQRKNVKGKVNITEFESIGHFHFKGINKTSNNQAWPRPTLKELECYGPKGVNLFKELFNLKGTSLMYYRDESNTHKKGIIHLKRKDEDNGKIFSGMIEYKGIGKDFKTKYISENQDIDIFGFLVDDIASRMMDDKFHSIDEWNHATHHLDYALYPDLISRHFKNPRSADIIISTKGKYTYKTTHGKKKRGSLFTHDIGLRESSVVPLIIGGSPEIPYKEISYCKSTDIVPTLLNLLGKKPHKSVIGNSLI
ncbi:MAG: alkaline phosphatase family protein [Promethearchaeota archaeon]